MRLKRAAQYLGGFVLAAALLAWVLSDTDPRAVWEAVGRASVPGLLLAAALMLSQNVFRVLRWRVLLDPVRAGVRFKPMFHAVILGYMTSWIVPGRLGELVRPALLAGREGLPLGACLGSVLADRVLDGIAVLGLFAVGAALTSFDGAAAGHAETIRTGALALVAIVTVPLAALIVVSRRRLRWSARLAGRSGPLAWAGRALFSFSEGVDALTRPGLLARALVQTALVWLAITGATWVGLRACGADVSFAGAMVLQPLLALGIALPTPGGAGGYHAAMKFGLVTLFGVSEPIAVGAGFLIHLAAVVPIVLLGTVWMAVDRVPLGDLVAAGRQVRALGSIPAEKSP